MKRNNNELRFEGKDKLKDDILYTRSIVRIFESEKDRRKYEDGGKYKEQFDRNLNHYKNKLEELNIKRKEQILEALKLKKESEQLPLHGWSKFTNKL